MVTDATAREVLKKLNIISENVRKCKKMYIP